ncbi:MAG: hypothetical protein U5L11_01655 [Arhodomonas sp.]|nr:hypothetical protein [Arhodomonas sp.]
MGPRLEHMRLHWSDPLLGLGARFPWLAEVRQRLGAGPPLALERLLLGLDWDLLSRARSQHRFDFRAVVIYALRWRIVTAWRRYNAEAAERRLQKGMHDGLGDYRSLFPNAAPRE